MTGSRIAVASTLALLATIHTSRLSSPSVRLYHEDPSHLWNRLHAALFVRAGADGREYGVDRVDPLLWIGSKYLLRGPAHDQAVRLLKEFVVTRGERLIDDPLRRATLQRDLWTVFDWLEGDHTDDSHPELSPGILRHGADDLRVPLATVIARLALTSEQVRSLPDNYAAAARAGALPPQMFAPGGPWVSVGRPDGPIATQHVRDLGPGKNSVFLVFIRLPDGRDATLRYLDQLRSFDGPLWVETTDQVLKPFEMRYPNPAVPQFPVGTRVALVRRALLIDANGRIIPTRLTEQVQLRVYRHIREMTAQEYADAHRTDENMFARAGQDFDEFSLSRAALFTGRSGGLLPLAAVDRFFLTFSSHGIDEFEMRVEGEPVTGAQRQEIGSAPADAKRLCKDCHAAPGVYSFNSYLPFRLAGPDAPRAPSLSEISLADAERTAVAWKAGRADWRALQPLLRK